MLICLSDFQYIFLFVLFVNNFGPMDSLSLLLYTLYMASVSYYEQRPSSPPVSVPAYYTYNILYKNDTYY